MSAPERDDEPVESAPVLRRATRLADARIEMINPQGWPAAAISALHGGARACGYSGGLLGVVTGLADGFMVAGTEMGYEDLAPLPVIAEEAGCRVTDLTGGPVLTGPGTVLMSTGQLHDELLDLMRPALSA